MAKAKAYSNDSAAMDSDYVDVLNDIDTIDTTDTADAVIVAAPKSKASVPLAELDGSPQQVRKAPIIRVEPNPGIRLPFKLKQAQAKVNSAGQALQDRDGGIIKVEEDVENAVQLPGTTRYLKPGLTASGLNTGLAFMVNNPYNDEQVYHPEWGEKVLKGKLRVLLQHILEYKHGKDFGYYSNRVIDRIYPSDKISEIPFFCTPQCQVPLDGSVTFLDLSNPLHEIWYYTLRAHDEIANSYGDLKTNRRALYYLVDDAEVHSVRINEKRKVNQAVSALEEVFNSSDSAIIKWAMALGNDDAKLSRDKAYDWLDTYFRRNEISFIKFTNTYEVYKNAARRAEFFAAAEVQDFINKGLIRTREGRYYWIQPKTDDTPLKTYEWISKDKLIHDFLIAPEYAEEAELLRSLAKARS